MNREKKSNKISVCYILSYKSPDYVRTRVILGALNRLENVELLTAINTNKGLLRYVQTLYLLIWQRLQKRPDVYILGFRGQEIYWPVRLLTLGKPLIFDEFINMHDWLGEENKVLPQFLVKLADMYERAVLKSAQVVLTDTRLDTELSSKVYKIPKQKFRTLYVGTDEVVFYPKQKPENKRLEVFFYGTIAPLHGIQYILEASKLLKDRDIHFTIVGGKGKRTSTKEIRTYIKNHHLNNVTFFEWIDYKKIAEYIAKSDVFLGGPFGNTSQSKRVITGKTFQALAMATTTLIGRISEESGFIDRENCLLVDQGSGEKIAQALSWAQKNQKKLGKIGIAGRELYLTRFSQKVVSKRIGDILEKL